MRSFFLRIRREIYRITGRCGRRRAWIRFFFAERIRAARPKAMPGKARRFFSFSRFGLVMMRRGWMRFGGELFWCQKQLLAVSPDRR
ncbi:hypothetical protein EAH78_23945 [Pseudomonas arsenicoxydans]|uniref:Uncharacterized protein n=1 Tax=Pseudomonas arsenicoxydans TaxID=702115 RepID=A0A502HMH7_9PSED|nr:hypothetical protein EAH78_23945 [Pseudomonas arsenicoxydans]